MGLGIQVGGIFNALPQGCTFLFGPLDHEEEEQEEEEEEEREEREEGEEEKGKVDSNSDDCDDDANHDSRVGTKTSGLLPSD